MTTKKPHRKAFQNPAVAVLQNTIEVMQLQVDAHLTEAAKLREDLQGPLLAKVEVLQDDQRQFLDLLKKMTARDTASANKAASKAAERAAITHMVPMRSAANI